MKIPKGGNQNLYIEEQSVTQCPKEKVQNDKQRSTKHTHKTKDRVTRTPLKTWGELRCSVRVSSSFSTSNTRRFNLVTNPVISGGIYNKMGVLSPSACGIKQPFKYIVNYCNLL